MTSTAPERFQPYLSLPQSHLGLLRGVVLSPPTPTPTEFWECAVRPRVNHLPWGAQLASSSFPLEGEAENPVSEA